VSWARLFGLKRQQEAFGKNRFKGVLLITTFSPIFHVNDADELPSKNLADRVLSMRSPLTFPAEPHNTCCVQTVSIVSRKIVRRECCARFCLCSRVV